MQMKCRPAGAGRLAVDSVADNWPAHLRTVHAQLMRTTGKRLKGKPGHVETAAHHFPGTRRRQTVAVRLHPPTARIVPLGERNVDAALIGIGPAFDHGPIAFADMALLEQ